MGSDTPLSFASGNLTPTEKHAKDEYDFMQQMRTKIVEEVGGQVYIKKYAFRLNYYALNIYLGSSFIELTFV